MPGPKSLWDLKLKKMKDGQRTTLTYIGFQALLRSGRRLKYIVSGRKIAEDKYSVVIYKNSEDKRYRELKKFRESRVIKRGNWDVDIHNLPIPLSAYLPASRPRMSYASSARR